MLIAREKEAELPPLRDRLPEDPVVTVPFEKIGTYGGTSRVFFTDYDKINAAENGRTVAPTSSKIFPNTIESWSFGDDARTVTFKLRAGLKGLMAPRTPRMTTSSSTNTFCSILNSHPYHFRVGGILAR